MNILRIQIHGESVVERSWEIGEALLDFRGVREYIVVQGLIIRATRVTIRVDDQRGNAINSGYYFEEAIHFFGKIQDKIIENAVELSYKHREKILQKIKLINYDQTKKTSAQRN